MPRTVRLAATSVLLAGAVTAAVTVGGTATAAPPAGKGSGVLIEVPAIYQAQFLCLKDLQPGVAAFKAMMLKAYPKTREASAVRTCSHDTTSEHQDGRAWDWGGVRASVASEKKTVQSLLDWLLAKDKDGNDFAMARRLGIMYIIWNKQMWRSYTGKWGPYSCTGVTACHQDHVHFSFGWAGAYKKTSYWTGSVAPPMAPPIPVLKSVGEEMRTTVLATKSQVYGAKSLVAALPYSLKVAGVWKYGKATTAQADGACRRGTDGKWTRSRTLRVDGVWNLKPTTDSGGGCNTKDHTYTATLTPRLSDAVSFSLDDASRTDNSGSVTVSLRLLPVP